MLNQKIIKLIDTIEVKMFKLNFKHFLLIKNGIKSVYLLIPMGLLVQKNGQTLIFRSNLKVDNNNLNSELNFFYSKLLDLNVAIEKIYTKKLLLKGLGLKATFIKQGLSEFKLGFSHSILLNIPIEIKLVIVKNMLIIESTDPIFLGNFASSIKNFKLPDSYKGKGICYKNEVLVLKAVKKT